MPEWPHDLLSGADRPRPLPAALRVRLEDVLLGAGVGAGADLGAGAGADADAGALGAATRPLGDELSARLEDELGDPLLAVFAGVDGPRPLPDGTRRALTSAMAAPARPASRRMTATRLASAAAVVVVLGGVALGLSLSRGNGTTAGSTASSLAAGTPRHPAESPTTTFPTTTVPGLNGLGSAGGDAAAPAQVPTAAPQVTAAVPATVTGVSPGTGPTTGGTTVTITGTGLSTVTSVRFGTVGAVSFTPVSDDELRAVAPAQAAGVVDVVVSGPSGTSAPTPADRFTYVG